MTKQEIRKIVEKDLLKFFDAKTLLSNNQILMELCMDSTLKAINYTKCCEELKDKTRYNNIEDTDPSWMSYIEDMKT